MKSLIISVLFLFCFGNLFAYSQVCEQWDSVEIRLQDENEKPVKNATIKFVDIPKGSALEGREFTEYEKSYGSLYVSTFCQSEIVGSDKRNKFSRLYDVLVSAKGYREIKTKISIYHCLGQCLVNRGLITIVREAAKLVTIKGTVKVSEPASYNKKGQLAWLEKMVAGAPIKFRRGTMVEFVTTSDADGNYKITVPVGAYGVYATASPGCFMCAEYFGNIVGKEDPTVLNIMLRFYGEG